MGRAMLPRPSCIVCGATCKGLKRLFCSYDCRGLSERNKQKLHALNNKWAFRGDNVTTWAHYKRMQKMCPAGPCITCGSNALSVIHHKDHNPANTVPSNLERMCRACHARHHSVSKRAA